MTEVDLTRRNMSFRSESFDAENNTIEIAYATDVPVVFGRIREALRIDEESISLRRFEAGHMYLIWDHRTHDARPVGRVIAHRIEAGEAVATVQLSEDPAHAGVIADLRSGMLRSVSAGFRVHASEEVQNDDGTIDVTITRWEPYEISLTVIPSDPASHVRSAAVPTEERGLLSRLATLLKRSEVEQPEEVSQETESEAVTVQQVEPAAEAPAIEPAEPAPTEEEENMTPEEILAAERSRVAAIQDMATRHALPADFVTRHIADGTTEDAARADALELLAARSAPETTGSRVTVTRDEHETFVQRAEAAVTSRMTGGEVPAEAREFRSLSMVELARRFVGEGANLMSRTEVVDAALNTRSGMHTTSDFSAILGNSANRTLRNAYQGVERTFTPFVSVTDLVDFRPSDRVQVGDAPELLKRAEGAEVKFGTFGESSETIKLLSYGRALSMTRQMLVNDDLNAFQRVLVAFGRRAAQLEADLVYGILSGNPKMADGKNLFSAGHKNAISAGISVAGFSAVRAKFSEQRGIDGGYINARPASIAVNPVNLTDAQKVLAPIAATAAGDVNPFAGGNWAIASDDRVATDRFFVFANPSDVDTIELAYLDGNRGVQSRTVENPYRDGVDVIASLDVGVAPLDFRGMLQATLPVSGE